jgi:hypothetical protein
LIFLKKYCIIYIERKKKGGSQGVCRTCESPDSHFEALRQVGNLRQVPNERILWQATSQLVS